MYLISFQDEITDLQILRAEKKIKQTTNRELSNNLFILNASTLTRPDEYGKNNIPHLSTSKAFQIK